MVRCGAGKRSNALSWIGLVGQEQSECKHTQACSTFGLSVEGSGDVCYVATW
jgi:hypothetical protein